MEPIRFDIVGCGAVVETRHVPVLRMLQGRGEVDVRGCFDLNMDNARRVATAVGAAQAGDEPTPSAGDGVDAVIVATPPVAHAEVSEAYLSAGKSVLLEKPFTSTLAEAKHLVALAREREVVAAVNHIWRYMPSPRIARDWLQEGGFNHIESVEGTEGFRWSWPTASPYVVEDPLGGVIHDTGAHLIDLVLFLLGLDAPEQEVTVDIEEISKTPAVEPSQECTARIALSGDDKSTLHVDLKMSRLQPLAHGVKVRGPAGVLFVPATLGPAPLLRLGPRGFRLRASDGDVVPADVLECTLLLYLDFLTAIRDRQAPPWIGADRFVLLSGILEALWRADG